MQPSRYEGHQALLGVYKWAHTSSDLICALAQMSGDLHPHSSSHQHSTLIKKRQTGSQQRPTQPVEECSVFTLHNQAAGPSETRLKVMDWVRSANCFTTSAEHSSSLSAEQGPWHTGAARRPSNCHSLPAFVFACVFVRESANDESRM